MKFLKLIKKYKVWIFLIAIAVGIITLIKEPVFFDSFGLPIFIFLFLSSIWMLNNRNKIPEWLIWVYITIFSLGILVDGINVLKI